VTSQALPGIELILPDACAPRSPRLLGRAERLRQRRIVARATSVRQSDARARAVGLDRATGIDRMQLAAVARHDGLQPIRNFDI